MFSTGLTANDLLFLAQGALVTLAVTAISVLAGTGFIVQSGSPTASLTSLAGYATLGAVFFLVSALRLRRTPKGDHR